MAPRNLRHSAPDAAATRVNTFKVALCPRQYHAVRHAGTGLVLSCHMSRQAKSGQIRSGWGVPLRARVRGKEKKKNLLAQNVAAGGRVR